MSLFARRASRLFALLVALARGTHAAAQSGSPAAPTVAAVQADAPPVIDGQLDDPVWSRVVPVTDFWTFRPVDDRPATERTEAYLAYDSENLYVGFRAYEAHPGQVRASLANRDAPFTDDLVAVFLDTFGDGRRAYLFFANPLGVQADGVTTEGGSDDYSVDLVWTSAGRRTEDGFVVEMAIPFRSLRFHAREETRWGIAFFRVVQHASEQQVFPRVDVDRNCLLCQMAVLAGLRDLRTGLRAEFLPTVTGTRRGVVDAATDRFAMAAPEVDVGLGAKLVPGPNWVLDLAFNPDFSQVETDASQVEVNQRFALFFPEKRPFFQEGIEIFQTPLPFVYTRTIFDPLVAAKLSAKWGRTTVGAVQAVDETPIVPLGESVPEGEASPDRDAWIGIVRVKRDIGESSSVGALVTDRRFGASFNRVVGVDAQWRFARTWEFTGQAAWTDTRGLDGVRRSDPAFAFELARRGEHAFLGASYDDLGPDVRAHVGFLRRVDLRQGRLRVGFQERPGRAVLKRWQAAVSYRRLYDHGGVLQDEEVRPGIFVHLARETFVALEASRALERFAGVDFWKTRLFLVAESAPWRLWSGGAFLGLGDQVWYDPDDPFLGYAVDVHAWSALRPSDALRLDLSVARSAFWRRAGGDEMFDDVIVRSKATYQFTRALSLRAIAEWNGFRDRLALNGLLSFVPSPGTVFFFGVDDLRDRQPGVGLEPSRRVWFVKASYLWRP